MNKEKFLMVLECALLSFQGLTYSEINKLWDIDPPIIKRGVLLSIQLKREA